MGSRAVVLVQLLAPLHCPIQGLAAYIVGPEKAASC
jgi:hypothetical protein